MYVLATVLGFITGYNVVEPIVRKVINVYNGYTTKQHNKLYYSILRKQKLLLKRGVNYHYKNVKQNSYTKTLSVYNEYLDKVNHLYIVVQMIVDCFCLQYNLKKYHKTHKFVTRLVNIILSSKDFNNYEKYELFSYGWLTYVKKLLNLRNSCCRAPMPSNIVTVDDINSLVAPIKVHDDMNNMDELENYINEEDKPETMSNEESENDELNDKETDDNDTLENDDELEDDDNLDNDDELDDDMRRTKRSIELLIEELFDVLNIQ